jgi:hypothetical protein
LDLNCPFHKLLKIASRILGLAVPYTLDYTDLTYRLPKCKNYVKIKIKLTSFRTFLPLFSSFIFTSSITSFILFSTFSW